MTGLGSLVRLALRRDRVLLAVWIIGLVGITLSTASSLEQLYGGIEARQQLAATASGNPAFLALLGPIHDASTIGGLLAWRWGVFGALLVGLMSMFLVTRHTRAEEETGRLELIGSAVVARHAPLAAAVVVALGASTVIGLLVAVGLTGIGQAAAGSFAFGLALASVGWVFTGVGAVGAQLSESARVTNSISGGALGAAYLLRAVGDAAGDEGPTWLTWLSPLGWLQHTRSFAGDRYWVLLLPPALFAVLLAVASTLVTKRDIGGGLLATRLGPPRAPRSLSGAFGLAWRLQRGMVIGWTISLFGLGVVYGSVGGAVEEMLSTNPSLGRIIAQMGGSGAIVDVYLASIIGIIALLSAIYVVQSTLRLRTEETGLRAESVLATPVSRFAWVGSHLLFATVGTAVVLAAAGVGAGLVHGARVGDVGGQVVRLAGAALTHVPAVWVVAGVALALFAVVPKLASASWAVIVVFLVLGQLGPVLQLDQWAMDLSPFTHIPKVSGADVSAGPLLWLTAVAAMLVAVGLMGFRRRDIG